jgi:hypothetical protein
MAEQQLEGATTVFTALPFAPKIGWGSIASWEKW